MTSVQTATELLTRSMPLSDTLANRPLRFINNEFVKGQEGKTFDVINPSDESVITQVHEATEKDVDIAVAAARKAFEGSWRQETPENRGKLLVNLANLFEKNIDLLAAVESLDNGKAISMAKVDISMCVGCLRYYGGWADKITGKVIDTTPDTFNYVKKEPIGGMYRLPMLSRRHCCLRV
jgi:aldehyde dehydrogenase (NAD+)